METTGPQQTNLCVHPRFGPQNYNVGCISISANITAPLRIILHHGNVLVTKNTFVTSKGIFLSPQFQ